jgi:metal-responsive CopG/Arc/MetJ family transcriptional regulator
MGTVTRVSVSLPPDVVKDVERDRKKVKAGMSFNLSSLIAELLREHYDKKKNGKVTA